jgi:hypothetical protein
MAKTIWMTQFDEVDEGTVIFKVEKNQNELPAEGTWLALDADSTALPNDWYLQLWRGTKDAAGTPFIDK